MFAAACDLGPSQHPARLAEDHEHARLITWRLAGCPGRAAAPARLRLLTHLDVSRHDCEHVASVLVSLPICQGTTESLGTPARNP